jgi:hypothetical protein
VSVGKIALIAAGIALAVVIATNKISTLRRLVS